MTSEEMFSALSQMSQFCAERVYKAKAAMMWDEVVLYTRWMEAVDLCGDRINRVLQRLGRSASWNTNREGDERG